MICTIISVVVQIFTLFYHFLRYKRRDYTHSSMTCLLCTAFTLQFVGFLGYYFIAGFISLKDVNKSQKVGDEDPKDFKWLAGIPIYLSLFILQGGLMLFGLFFTRKGFK